MDIPSLDEVREYHLGRLNDALRRPGVWGGETTLRLFLDAVAFMDGRAAICRREQEQLPDGNPLGVRAALAHVAPGCADDGAVASVYAEIAWRHGWLTADRVLPAAHHRRLRLDADWCTRDRDLEEVRAEFGPPSVRCGSGNVRYPTTWVYATADRTSGLVSLHFAGSREGTAQPLIARRYGAGPFRDTVVLTPAGSGRT